MKAAAIQERKQTIDPRHEELPHGDFPHLDMRPLQQLDDDECQGLAQHILWPLAVTSLLATIIIVVVMLIGIKMGWPRDLGQWNNMDAAERFWFQNLMQPDNPTKSCCGEADGYWADESHVIDGQIVAVITDSRSDDQSGRIHEEVGARYIVPPNKITRKDGNPTGHVLIFLGGVTYDGTAERMRPVLCYVLNGGV